MTDAVKAWTVEPAEALRDAIDHASTATRAIWFIFVLALMVGVGLRFERTARVLEDIGPIVDQINAVVVADPTASVVGIQSKLTGELNTETDGGYAALVRVLAYKYKQTPGLDKAALRDRFKTELKGALLRNWLMLSVIHLALLSIFPGSFSITVRAALAGIRKRAADPPTTFRETVVFHRNRTFLKEEGRLLFWRRLAVFMLFSMSITYLMAPAGLYASTIGELLTIYPVPGDITQPYWFAEFSRVQPFVLGLAGFLTYSLITFAHGVTTGELGNRLFLTLWNRGMTVVILSLVLTAMQLDSALLNALIFIAGVFPQTGLQAIAKAAQRGAEQAAALNPVGLAALPQIDSFGENSLRSLGIHNVADLAGADLTRLLELSSLQPSVLLKAVDRALLLDSFGELHQKLNAIPARNASSLVLYVEGRDAYMDRWGVLQQNPPRHLAPQLSDGQKKARLNEVNTALGAADVSTLVTRLKHTANLQFIIDNALCYPDA